MKYPDSDNDYKNSYYNVLRVMKTHIDVKTPLTLKINAWMASGIRITNLAIIVFWGEYLIYLTTICSYQYLQAFLLYEFVIYESFRIESGVIYL